jgi:DNA-binding transcriptional LysR family regulator
VVLLRQLEYLVALSQERHFARAAEACHVSQPALSEAIRKLEAELDVQLIRRERKFEDLTPEGQRIVVWAQRMLAVRDALTNEVEAMRTGLSGRLRIGSVPTVSTAVSLLTEPFCSRNPLASVRLASDLTAQEILRKLGDFEIDAGVTYLDDEVRQNFHTVPLYQEKYFLLTSLSGAFSSGTEARWAEVAHLPLCLLTESMQGRRVLDTIFAAAGVEPAPRLETDSIASLVAHVGTGRWVSVVPCAWLHALGIPRGMRAVPMIEPTRSALIGLVTATAEHRSVMAEALLGTVRYADLTVLEHIAAEPAA